MQLVKQALELIPGKRALKKYYAQSLKCFSFFKGVGSGSLYSMQFNEFLSFMNESKIGEVLDINDASILFDVVNDELTKTFLEGRKEGDQIITDELRDDLNDDRSIVRFEWQECLLRLAAKVFEMVLLPDDCGLTLTLTLTLTPTLTLSEMVLPDDCG